MKPNQMKPEPIDILNEIRMQRALRPNETALLLEGRADCAYFRRVVCRNRCRLYPAHGKIFARRAARLALEKGVPGIVALLDRDHDHLLSRETDSPNVMYTDANDFETTIIQSNAFEEYLHEYLDYDDRDRILNGTPYQSIGELLLQISGEIGVLRVLNLQHTWDLKCRDIEVDQVFNRDEMRVDSELLVDHVFQLSDRPMVDLQEVKEVYLRALEGVDDFTLYATGHDTTRLLAMLLSSQIWLNDEIDLTGELVEHGLRLCFSVEHFKATDICQALREWENANAPFLVLKMLEEQQDD